MGYSKKLYNVLGGYEYYNSTTPILRKYSRFTNITIFTVRFCTFRTYDFYILSSNIYFLHKQP